LIFCTGAATLGMELSASRLLEPAFGNNQIVWAALIGLILFYLALGAWLGGVLADRYPQRRALDLTVTLGAVGIALVPLLSTPVLRMAAGGLARFDSGLLAGALLAVLLLFAVPATLLGTATPWAIRLSVQEIGQTGHVAGRMSAIATAGSLVGTFVPVLWLIPAVGTRWTFFILALVVLGVQSVGNLRRPHRWIPLTGLALVAGMAWLSHPGGPLRMGWDDDAGTIIYEDESLYNYIAVRQWGSERHLELNDGVGIHSVYHPETALSLGIWDYFLLAPLFHAPPMPAPPVDNMLIIGLAAGTVSELVTDIYGPVPITGVELDPQIIAVGQAYFNMTQPNLTPVAADGRAWLAQQPPGAQWDVIAVDAYRPPYIPFHLTTVEFFQLVRAHLTPDGVLAINVGRTDTNFALVDALAATLAQVFPAVYAIDEPGPPATLANTLVVATMRPVDVATVRANIAALDTTYPPEFRSFAQEASTQIRPANPPLDAPVFTDDKAPVERVVHGIILDYLTLSAE
ncbi:MAG: fused MFS/spermidine synthase, partial [Caldilineaceae bacterium]|nr:fused MFS/spermidine synthase [Caldilineaceae bacterium]